MTDKLEKINKIRCLHCERNDLHEAKLTPVRKERASADISWDGKMIDEWG